MLFVYEWRDYGKLERITRDSGVTGGKACIRRMHVTVSMIVAQIGAGRSIKTVLEDYPLP